VRRIALTVLLASALVLAGGGVAVAEPGHNPDPGHHNGDDRFPTPIALPTGFQPEGISIGKGANFYVGSVATGAIYRGSVRTGEGAVLVPGVATPAGEPQKAAAIGTEVDQRNRLWVAGGPTGVGHVYDAKSGAELKTYVFVDDPVTTPTFVNDVVVTKDAAYFTDSFNAVLYVVPIGRGGRLGDEVQTLPLTGQLQYVPGEFNANGIEASPDGRTLLVVQSNKGQLFTVSPKSGATEQVDLGGASVLNGDGLLLQRGSTLYVVRNQDNLIAVFKLDRSLRSGRLVDTIEDPDFDVPTTVAAFGKFLYAVNARFGVLNPDTQPYSIVRVDAHR
jgi:sugar lactone lactonase YvrE